MSVIAGAVIFLRTKGANVVHVLAFQNIKTMLICHIYIYTYIHILKMLTYIEEADVNIKTGSDKHSDVN